MQLFQFKDIKSKDIVLERIDNLKEIMSFSKDDYWEYHGAYKDYKKLYKKVNGYLLGYKKF